MLIYPFIINNSIISISQWYTLMLHIHCTQHVIFVYMAAVSFSFQDFEEFGCKHIMCLPKAFLSGGMH